MFNKENMLAVLLYLSIAASNVCAFNDPISIFGRIKWNYTKYEENVWTREFSNTSLEQIFEDHTVFMEKINGIYGTNDSLSFYPSKKDSANSLKITAPVDAFIHNPYNVPIIDSILSSNEQITEFWWKFVNWTSFNATNMLDELTNDAIPVLQTSTMDLWNTSNTLIFFDFLKNKSFACDVMDQHELAIYKLTEKYFADTIVLQLKAYIMLQLSYLTKASKDFKLFHKIARDERVKFNGRYTTFTHESESVVWNLSRVVWACDKFSEPNSYTQLTNFIQGYVDNEINLNPDGSCAPYCRDYKETKNYNCHNKTYCGANYFDKNKTRCDGVVRDCDYFEASMTICPNENDSDINRRINFVKLQSGRLLGHDQFCADQYDAKPFSYWLQTCRYCFCYCDAPGVNSHRHFSLREITSNIQENKVLSGVRLLKKNGIIHLSAVERSLLPNAQLELRNHSLVLNDSFSITDKDIKEGVDYHTMTYENRTINLDLISSSRDMLVTGVRFRVHSGAVHLQVRFTYFDESTGKLDLSEDSVWKMNSNIHRYVIPTKHLDVPIKSLNQTYAFGTIDSEAVEFEPTGWVRDMAQTTVPFIDTVQVEPYEVMPLSGLGLFYKLQHGYGGYISPRLLTYDFAGTALRVRAAVGVYGV